MGIAQGARMRIATERTKMAMPETNIGLFPDVGGGYFLGRCPGHIGEYLALTGHMLGGAQAAQAGLADGVLPADRQRDLWDSLHTLARPDPHSVRAWVGPHLQSGLGAPIAQAGAIERFFNLPTVAAIVHALEAAAAQDSWARDTAAALRQRSPLMLHVALEQVRRGRHHYKATRTEVVSGRIPIAVHDGQGRGFELTRTVPGAKGPYKTASREYLVRSRDRFVLVQVVVGNAEPAGWANEVARVMETISVD